MLLCTERSPTLWEEVTQTVFFKKLRRTDIAVLKPKQLRETDPRTLSTVPIEPRRHSLANRRVGLCTTAENIREH